MPSTYKGKGPVPILMEPDTDDTDASYRSALNQFLQARQRPDQSPEAFYNYVRRLEKKLEYLPAHFSSGHLYSGLLPGLQEGLAIRGITSESTRDEIVKRANTLWEPTSLTATRLAADAAAAEEAGASGSSSSTARPSATSSPTEEMRRAKRRAKQAAKRIRRRQEHQYFRGPSGGRPSGPVYMSGLAVVDESGSSRPRVVGQTGYVDYDADQNGRQPVFLQTGYAEYIGPHQDHDVVKQEDRGDGAGMHYASPMFGPDSLMARVECPECRQLGHFARDCPGFRRSARPPYSRPYTRPVRGAYRGRAHVRRRGPSY